MYIHPVRLKNFIACIKGKGSLIASPPASICGLSIFSTSQLLTLTSAELGAFLSPELPSYSQRSRHLFCQVPVLIIS